MKIKEYRTNLFKNYFRYDAGEAESFYLILESIS
jgi:hypothetical protein